MPSKLPWFPFCPSDFLLDDKVSQMTTLQCGAYTRLLCHAWLSHPKGTLPATPSILARMAYMTEPEWHQNQAQIMAPFTLIDDRWHQKRMMAEGASAEEKHAIFVDAGKRGAAAKKGLSQATREAISGAGSNHNHNHRREKKI